MNWRKPGGIRMWGFWVATGVTTLMAVLYLIGPRFLDDLENKSLDFRFLTRGEAQPTGTIGIVAIDEDSIAEFGRWPWSRDRMADLIDGISAAGAKVIVVDIIYSEPEITDRLKTIQDIRSELEMIGSDQDELNVLLQKKQQEASTDALFAEAIGNAGTVVMAIAPIIIGTDHDPYQAAIEAGVSEGVRVVRGDSVTLDLYAFAQADLLIANCVSTFSALAVRERRGLGRPSVFFGFEEWTEANSYLGSSIAFDEEASP